MGKRIPEQKKKQKSDSRIPDEVTELRHDGSTNHLKPVFSFSSACKQSYQLSDMQSDELSHLINQLRLMSDLTWQDVYRHKGIGYKGPIDNYKGSLPEWLDSDVKLFEFRISKRGRVMGYRSDQTFHIIWFDRNHDVCSMS